MTDKQRDMIAGVDWLLRKFNKYGDSKEFTVEEIIKASNEAVQEILTDFDNCKEQKPSLMKNLNQKKDGVSRDNEQKEAAGKAITNPDHKKTDPDNR